MLIRARRRKESVNWKERCGEIGVQKPSERPRVWLHAVSVGEVVAAKPILREIRNLHPDVEVILSVTTSSGHKIASETASELFDYLTYFPIDVARFQLAAMVRAKPKVVAIMETELWMNFLWASKVVGAATMLVNGRISDRSFPRARFFAFFYRAMLRDLDQALMQSPVDAERIQILGARSVETLGNCKFDQALEWIEADAAALRIKLGIPHAAFVIVVGSTRGEEEEALVVDALSDPRFDSAWIVHAPRHLETVPSLVERVGAKWGGAKLRSKRESGQYLILDTYGELAKVYAIADLVIIGGGFSNSGGQNLLQPLALGKPVIHGPHMQNFAEVAAMAKKTGCTRTASTAEQLADVIEELMISEKLRQEMSVAAKNLVSENAGASKRYAMAIIGAIKDS